MIAYNLKKYGVQAPQEEVEALVKAASEETVKKQAINVVSKTFSKWMKLGNRPRHIMDCPYKLT